MTRSSPKSFGRVLDRTSTMSAPPMTNPQYSNAATTAQKDSSYAAPVLLQQQLPQNAPPPIYAPPAYPAPTPAPMPAAMPPMAAPMSLQASPVPYPGLQLQQPQQMPYPGQQQQYAAPMQPTTVVSNYPVMVRPPLLLPSFFAYSSRPCYPPRWSRRCRNKGRWCLTNRRRPTAWATSACFWRSSRSSGFPLG